jgi:hypothetical protein
MCCSDSAALMLTMQGHVARATIAVDYDDPIISLIYNYTNVGKVTFYALHGAAKHRTCS